MRALIDLCVSRSMAIQESAKTSNSYNDESSDIFSYKRKIVLCWCQLYVDGRCMRLLTMEGNPRLQLSQHKIWLIINEAKYTSLGKLWLKITLLEKMRKHKVFSLNVSSKGPSSRSYVYKRSSLAMLNSVYIVSPGSERTYFFSVLLAAMATLVRHIILKKYVYRKRLNTSGRNSCLTNTFLLLKFVYLRMKHKIE